MKKLLILKQYHDNFPTDFVTSPSDDKKVDYQICQSSCEGIGGNLKINLENLLNERGRLGAPNISNGRMGDSKSLTA